LDVTEDKIESAKYHLLGAEAGYMKSQYRIARYYDKEYGVEKNHESAANWYEKAARQGYAKAQYMLGIHYAKGKGKNKNYVKAYAWLLLAKNINSDHIDSLLEKISKKISASEVYDAEELAYKWMSKYEINTKAQVNL